VASVLRDQSGGVDVPSACEITRIDYAGDEGGIVCRLEFGREMGGRAVSHRSRICASMADRR
jgi:hypothetical protein